MGINRLPPPNVAGTIPSFYSTDLGTSLEVPFSMNAMVGKTAVGGFQLRFKTTSTDIVLINMESDTYSLDNESMSVTFDLSSIKSKLVAGNFYKLQIAYVDRDTKVIGYYSTVSVVKYTSAPTISIVGLNKQAVTQVGSQRFIGLYQNSDASEKVYQYKFVLFNGAGIEIENSGWLLHNVQQNDQLTESQDIYAFIYNLTENMTYYVQYSVKTNNGLDLHTVKYKVALSLFASTKINVSLQAELDYDNARVKVSLMPNAINIDPETKEEIPTLLHGMYVISRASSKDNFQYAETLQNNNMNLSVSVAQPYVFYDYAVEAGVEYRYFIQKYNSQNIFSQKVQSNLITVFFEDIYLYDGKQQLRIRFNPKVSSFKAVVSDSKKTTLGRQYPFIFRNGILNYKEFPISGLISYQIDNDELFMSKDGWRTAIATYTDGQVKYENFTSNEELSDTNFKYEKLFKLCVLDWLNNGTIKLFKSPQEGNYIVRLTNVSLTPNETVSRLLHTFSCTASEVAEYSLSNLAEYSLVNDVETEINEEIVKIINIREIWDRFRRNNGQDEDKTAYLAKLAEYDFTEGNACKKIRFMHQRSDNEADLRKEVYGMAFQWGDQNFAIDRSGFAEIVADNFITAELRLLNPGAEIRNAGYLELTLLQTVDDNLDSVSGTNSLSVFGYGGSGIIEPMEEVYDEQGLSLGMYSRNLLEEFNSHKSILSDVQTITYRLVPLYRAESALEITNSWNAMKTLLDLEVDPADFFGERCYLYQEYDTGRVYWKWNAVTESLEKVENYGTNVLFGDTIQDITVLQDKPSINFFTSVPRDSNGKVMFRIQNGVQAYIYGTQNIVSYLIEQYDLRQLAQDEEEAYETYCAKLYNFRALGSEREVANLSDSQKRCIYIFKNRVFEKISADSVASYIDLYRVYVPKPLSAVTSEEDLKTSWGNYLTRKKYLDLQLKRYLEQEEE